MSTKALSSEEIEKLAHAEFKAPSWECAALCGDVQATVDQLEDPDLTPDERERLVARLRALDAQLAVLQCAPCWLQ